MIPGDRALLACPKGQFGSPHTLWLYSCGNLANDLFINPGVGGNTVTTRSVNLSLPCMATSRDPRYPDTRSYHRNGFPVQRALVE
jgi:hypothetical protein